MPKKGSGGRYTPPSKPPPFRYTKANTGEPANWVWDAKRREWVSPVQNWWPKYPTAPITRAQMLEALAIPRKL